MKALFVPLLLVKNSYASNSIHSWDHLILLQGPWYNVCISSMESMGALIVFIRENVYLSVEVMLVYTAVKDKKDELERIMRNSQR